MNEIAKFNILDKKSKICNATFFPWQPTNLQRLCKSTCCGILLALPMPLHVLACPPTCYACSMPLPGQANGQMLMNKPASKLTMQQT